MTDGLTIARLQAVLDHTWGQQDYTDEFRANEAPHKRMTHDLLHLMGSLGGLAKMVEELDHPGALVTDAARRQYRKLLADLVIVAMNGASQCPAGEFDMEDAVRSRVLEKFKGAADAFAQFAAVDAHGAVADGR